MDPGKLYAHFKKGTTYFAKEFAEGRDNPIVRRQLADFEKQVIAPLDAACAKMDAIGRAILEAEYVPF
jgi:hypothetical protein